MDHKQPTDTGKRHRNTRFMEISIYFLNRFYGLVLCNSNKLLSNYTARILLITNISNSNMLLKIYKNAHQSKCSISKNARLSCLKKLCKSKALLPLYYLQILSMNLKNRCCHNCANSKINSLHIWSYLNRQKVQIYRNG